MKFKRSYEHSFPLFVELKLLPARYLYVYKVLRSFYVRSGYSPPFISASGSYHLRREYNVYVCRPNLTLYKRSFLYMGAKTFNVLPVAIRREKIFSKFLRLVKNWLFTKKNIDDLF